MMKMEVALKRERKRWLEEGTGGGIRVFHGYVREALKKAASEWIDRFLPLHFGVMSFGRYNYAPRSGRYQNYKRNSPWLRKNVWGGTPRQWNATYVPNLYLGQTPEPFRYTGELKDYVLANRQAGNILSATRAVSRGQEAFVRIPVQLPHPIHPKNAGELTKLLAGEKAHLTAVFNRELARLVKEDIAVADAA